MQKEEEIITHYKILNKKGLYSTGGFEPSFEKKGKTWKRLRDLKSHLTQYKKNDFGRPNKQIPEDWTIEEFVYKKILITHKQYSANKL